MGEDWLLTEMLKNNLAVMRGKLGKSCTYLSFEREGDITFLHAKLVNQSKGKDTVRQKINIPLQNLNREDFENMFNVLNDRAYDS